MAIIGKHGISANTPGSILLGAGTYHKNLKFENGAWTGKCIGATSGGGKIAIAGEFSDIELDGALVKVKGLTVKQGGTATMEINFVELSGDMLMTTTLFKEGESDVIAHPGYPVMEARFAADGVQFLKIDIDKYTLTTNQLAGTWIKVGDQTAYVGANSADTLNLCTDETMTTPKLVTCDAGAVIYNANGGDLVPAIPAYNMYVDKAHIEEGDYLENFGFVGLTADGSKQIVVIFDYAICTSGLELEGKNKENSVIKATLEAAAAIDGTLDTLPVRIYYPASV